MVYITYVVEFMSMRALDQSNDLGDTLESLKNRTVVPNDDRQVFNPNPETNTGAAIAETDCWISCPDVHAVSENGASIIALDFSNLPVKKTEQLSTVGGRPPASPGDWLTTRARLVHTLRNGVNLATCHTVIDTADPFVFHVEVTPSLTSEAMVAAAEYLGQFGLNCGIVHS